MTASGVSSEAAGDVTTPHRCTSRNASPPFSATWEHRDRGQRWDTDCTLTYTRHIQLEEGTS